MMNSIDEIIWQVILASRPSSLKTKSIKQQIAKDCGTLYHDPYTQVAVIFKNHFLHLISSKAVIALNKKVSGVV